MKILLLGGTGRTGRLVLEEAVARGHEVTALVRDTGRVGETVARMVEGSPYDPGEVDRAIGGSEAVVSALNVSRKSDNPFSALRAPKDLMSRSIGHTIEAMGRHGVRRIAVISSIGVGDSKPRMPTVVRGIMALTNIRHAMRDHERQEQLLRESNLDWTIVRPAMLNDGDPGEIRVATTPDEPIGGKTSRRTVARFLVHAVENGSYFCQAPLITDG